MDLVASCRDKLTYFRIKDLKDVLTQLAITKQGKKQDLINRILALLSDDQGTRFLAGGKRTIIGKEGIAKIIEDTYRKIHFSGATDLASESHNLDSNNANYKAEVNDTFKVDMKVRCSCGHSSITESMVKCEDSACQVWQHVSCVVVPEKPMERAQLEIPKHFYCEVCRIKRADPFWMTQAHPLLPSKLPCTSIPHDGTNNVQTVERTFQLSRGDIDLLQKVEYGLQVWCILLNDAVPFRMQWPQFTELLINGDLVRTGSQLLGANGRDDGPIITRCSHEGINRISLSKSDARVFSFGIRIARRRTVQQVMNLIPKEAEGECFEDALARVRRCIGGGTATENAGSDSDIEVVADSVVVNLRCPMSGARIKTAGRCKPCDHMRCFDLGTFVELNQRSRKWQCPICLKNYSLEDIIIDPYFNRITSMLRYYEEDVDEIDIKPDGSWRVRSEKCKDPGKWYSPDGSLLFSIPIVRSELEALKQSKQDVFNEQKDPNGFWENNKQETVNPPLLSNCAMQKFGNLHQQTAFMSSSATGSYREGDDSSINQEGGGYFDFSSANAYEFDSALNFGIPPSSDDMVLTGPSDKDVICFSDSDEDNATLTIPEPSYDIQCVGTASIPFSAVDPGVSGLYSGAPGFGTSAAPCMGTFGNGDNFGASLWPLSTCNQIDISACTQTGPFEFFDVDSNADMENTLTDAQQDDFCWPSKNGSTLKMDDARINALQMGDYLSHHSNLDDIGVLLDNPLAFDNVDPLQIFLPTQPSGPVQRNLNLQEGMPDALEAGDWISLRLGDTGLSHNESAPPCGLDSGQQFQPKQIRRDFLADTDSLHLSMNNDEISSNKVVTNLQRTDGISRSVKPRLSLSIDMNLD